VSDTPLILPFDVEGAIVSVIDRHHAEHLAKLERLRGLQPRTFEPFATVVRMADATGVRLSGDTVPALLLGIIGAPILTRNEDDKIDAVFQLGMQITAMGEKRRDTILRRDVYAWTVVELVYQRLPRGRDAICNSVRLVDYEPVSESETQRTLADARLVWEIGVKDILAITGFLPPDDLPVPPNEGGPPDDPYTPPVPVPVTAVTVEIDRDPIVE
jgi:hypothetical protein